MIAVRKLSGCLEPCIMDLPVIFWIRNYQRKDQALDALPSLIEQWKEEQSPLLTATSPIIHWQFQGVRANEEDARIDCCSLSMRGFVPS